MKTGIKPGSSIVGLFVPMVFWGLIVLSFSLTARTEGVTFSILPSAHAMVQIDAESGRVFVVESKNELSDSFWLTRGTIEMSGPLGVWLDPVSASGRHRFYRISETTKPDARPLPNMVWIPPGTFTMGSPLDELDREEWEGPETVVTITTGFWIGQTELTQEEFSVLAGFNRSFWQDCGFNCWLPVIWFEPQRPVEHLTWGEVVSFCASVTNDAVGQGNIPEGFEYRLPTEAEWEYACRAGTSTRFSYGDDPIYSLNDFYAISEWNSGEFHYEGPKEALLSNPKRPRRVGQKRPNPWGLYDMHGNVFEWTLDKWPSTYPGGHVIDPTGVTEGVRNVVRGGRWVTHPKHTRSAARSTDLKGGGHVGFRMVLAKKLDE